MTKGLGLDSQRFFKRGDMPAFFCFLFIECFNIIHLKTDIYRAK